MLTLYALKPRFQRALAPLVPALVRAGLSPNALTAMGFAVALATGAAIAWGAVVPAALLLVPVGAFARMALNALDGMLARELRRETRGGALANELGDVASDVVSYGPLALLFPAHAVPVAAFVGLSIVSEGIGALGARRAGARLNGGPMGKSDRAFAVGAIALGAFAWPEASALWGLAMGALALLVGATIVGRTRRLLAR